MNNLATDPAFTAATILAVTMTPAPARPGADLELAAYPCRSTARGLEKAGSAYVRLPSPAQSSVPEIVRRSGLSADQVVGLPAAAIALAYLDERLAAPPYIIVVHGAAPFVDLLDQHRGRCPALAAADLVDTARWAHLQHGIPASGSVRDCARALQIDEPRPGYAARTDARLTAAVFGRLAFGQDTGWPTSLAGLVGAAGRPGRQAVAA